MSCVFNSARSRIRLIWTAVRQDTEPGATNGNGIFEDQDDENEEKKKSQPILPNRLPAAACGGWMEIRIHFREITIKLKFLFRLCRGYSVHSLYPRRKHRSQH